MGISHANDVRYALESLKGRMGSRPIRPAIKTIKQRWVEKLMGVPGADVRYVLERLRKIEICLCNEPCSHEECDRGFCTHPLRLLRELQAELEAIRVGH